MCRALLVSFLALGACSSGDDFDLSGELSPVPFSPDGKDDGAGQPAIRVDADVHDTEVWKIRNHWEDINQTEEARAAGIAWSADSGLSWDQKYSAWVEAMRQIPQADSSYMTYELITPFGKTVPSPALECAETAMFLRATFASWYGLPFFMEAADKKAGRVFFGHFGVRTMAGRWQSSPLYPQYQDYTATWKPGQPWPHDGKLQKVRLDSSVTSSTGDAQPELGPDTHLGAYLDEIYLNKRSGYFVAYLLDYFFSGNLADTVNTYNLQPKAIRTGDFFLHRESHNGIGHTLVVKHVAPYNNDTQILVQLVAGSMPRIQGLWQDETSSKLQIIADSAGGIGDSDDKPIVPVWQLGGGLKRWRAARAIGGSWVNTFMPDDKGSWIASTDGAQLGSRPKFFEAYIGDIPVTERRDAYLKIITVSRDELSKNPSSCASRANRERAFGQLNGLTDALGLQWGDIAFKYRTLDDAVFATLGYARSKTCCWDSSSPSMYRIIMDHAAEEIADAKAKMMCVSPTVFAANSTVPDGYDGPIDGYQVWRAWAAKKGRSAEWVDSAGKPAVWHEDEPCQGASVKDDTTYRDFSYCDSLTPPAPPPDLSDPPATDGGVGDPDLSTTPSDMGV